MCAFLLFAALMQAGTPDFATIARGDASGVGAARTVVVREMAAWQTLWREHDPNGPAPAVDFSTDMVAAVFLGTRSTGGYRVELLSTRREADEVVLQYRERRPNPDRLVTQALTAPFHIVRLPRHAGSVRFQRVE